MLPGQSAKSKRHALLHRYSIQVRQRARTNKQSWFSLLFVGKLALPLTAMHPNSRSGRSCYSFSSVSIIGDDNSVNALYLLCRADVFL